MATLSVSNKKTHKLLDLSTLLTLAILGLNILFNGVVSVISVLRLDWNFIL